MADSPAAEKVDIPFRQGCPACAERHAAMTDAFRRIYGDPTNLPPLLLAMYESLAVMVQREREARERVRSLMQELDALAPERAP